MTKGYQVTFFMEQERKHGHQPLHEWLLFLARSLGVQGGTSMVCAEGYGRAGKLHMAHFFTLRDQPIEVTMAMTERQVETMFERLDEEKVDLFYIKAPVEYGMVGVLAAHS